METEGLTRGAPSLPWKEPDPHNTVFVLHAQWVTFAPCVQCGSRMWTLSPACSLLPKETSFSSRKFFNHPPPRNFPFLSGRKLLLHLRNFFF